MKGSGSENGSPRHGDSPSPEVVDSLVAASRALVAVAARSLAAAADEVTLAQYRTLVVLASKGPQRVADLAGALAVTPATATRMCDRLVAKELVDRHTEEDDRRQVRIALTKRGRQLVDEVTDSRRHEITTIVSRIPPDQQSVLVEALSAFAESAGEIRDEDWATGWDL